MGMDCHLVEIVLPQQKQKLFSMENEQENSLSKEEIILIEQQILNKRNELCDRSIGSAANERAFILEEIQKILARHNTSFKIEWDVKFSHDFDEQSGIEIGSFYFDNIFILRRILPSSLQKKLKFETLSIDDMNFLFCFDVGYFNKIWLGIEKDEVRLNKIKNYISLAKEFDQKNKEAVSEFLVFLMSLLHEYQYYYFQFVFGYDAIVTFNNNTLDVKSIIPCNNSLEELSAYTQTVKKRLSEITNHGYFQSLYGYQKDEAVEFVKANMLSHRIIGTPDEELQYIKAYFNKLFEGNTNFTSLKWEQGVYYNDNFSYYDILEFLINKDLDISFYCSFTNSGSNYDNGYNLPYEVYEPFNWQFEIKPEEEDEDDDEIIILEEDKEREVRNFNYIKSLSLRETIIEALIFFKALFEHYGFYYFMYVFEYESEVEITPNKIEIKASAKNNHSYSQLKEMYKNGIYEYM
jgi:hypothetical protein